MNDASARVLGWGSMFGKRHQEEESDVPASTKSAGALPSLQKKKVESTPVSPTIVVEYVFVL